MKNSLEVQPSLPRGGQQRRVWRQQPPGQRQLDQRPDLPPHAHRQGLRGQVLARKILPSIKATKDSSGQDLPIPRTPSGMAVLFLPLWSVSLPAVQYQVIDYF